MGKRSTKYYRKNEAEVMERLGLKPTINSGAGWMEKEDGISEHFICQLKSTDKESMSIKQHDLHTLEIHASESHKLPVFAFQFLNRDEVWLAVKESDIEAIRAVVRGEEEMHHPTCFGEYTLNKCDRCMFWDKCKEKKEHIDEQEETEYNGIVPEVSASRSLQAKRAYMERRQKEAERRREEMKETIKERRRKQNKLWRKS